MDTAVRQSRHFRAWHGCAIGVVLLTQLGVRAQTGDPVPEAGDQFGSVLARGDFNNDGYQDLAVGVPYEDISTGAEQPITDAGAVEVIYGSGSGLAAIGRQFWRQGVGGVNDLPDFDERFGSSLAVGDFNGDGYDDLAIGVPYETVGTAYRAGAVHVLYGSATGLSTTTVPDQFWHQNKAGVADIAEPHEWFGRSLAAGDFNGDNRDDLAIGVTESIGTASRAGAVHVLHGTNSGLTTDVIPDQFWHQDSPGIDEVAETNESFGWTLSAGNFNGDQYADLAIGVPWESVYSWSSTITAAGAVHVLYGSSVSLATTAPPGTRADQFWHQDQWGVEDASEPNDLFGAALTSGDFNGDGFSDLAIGVPNERIGDVWYAGAVNILYGSPTGLIATAGAFWHQDQPNIEDATEYGDVFGTTLTAGDFDDDGHDDLVIGVPGESVGTVAYAGAVNVLYGSPSGVRNDRVQFWHQDASSVEDISVEQDDFGAALVAGDFNGDGSDDLAIGIPGDELIRYHYNIIDPGAVGVIYGNGGLGLSALYPADQRWTQAY